MVCWRTRIICERHGVTSPPPRITSLQVVLNSLQSTSYSSKPVLGRAGAITAMARLWGGLVSFCRVETNVTLGSLVKFSSTPLLALLLSSKNYPLLEHPVIVLQPLWFWRLSLRLVSKVVAPTSPAFSQLVPTMGTKATSLTPGYSSMWAHRLPTLPALGGTDQSQLHVINQFMKESTPLVKASSYYGRAKNNITNE